MKAMKQITQEKKITRSRSNGFCCFGLVLVSLFLLGMAFAPKSSPAIGGQVGQALANLKSCFESENLSDFMALLDKDYEDRLTFQSTLQDYFISHKNPEIMIITDAVLINQDKVSARLHWFRKNTDNSGSFSKSQGSSQLVFKQCPEGLRLIYIRQDNPFF